MATNLRAYRDGNRLVLVIENPTKDLESIVGALISGEVNPVKDLTEPKPMAKPKVDVSQMQEIPSKPEVSPITQPVAQEPPKKAPFVKKLEEMQAAAKTNAERPINDTQVKPQMPVTAMHAQMEKKVEEGTKITAVGEKSTDTTKATQTVKTSAVSNVAKVGTPQSSAKSQVTAKQQISTPATNQSNVQTKPQMQEAVTKSQSIANKPSAQVMTNASSERAALIKRVWNMRGNAKVKALLKAKYQDENYDIRRLSTAQLEYLSKL